MFRVYDLECYPNVFLYIDYDEEKKGYNIFEISEFKNEWSNLLNHLLELHKNKVSMVGFNNLSYDYPLLHHLITTRNPDYNTAFKKSSDIMNTPWEERFRHILYGSEQLIKQIDLFKIHHFDNKGVSLKQLEFVMRSESLEDLPFSIRALSREEIEVLKSYGANDVKATYDFYKLSIDKIKFRFELSAKYELDLLNDSDAKIGSEITKHYIPKNLLFDGYKKRQTRREYINLKDAVFSYIKFNSTEFNRVKQFFESQIITETKGFFKQLECVYKGLVYKFGTGGLHASRNNKTYGSDRFKIIIDLDVTSYYPSLGIVNKIYPEHIGPTYCETQELLKAERLKHEKGTSENAAFKLALNAGYGNSNNPHSVFYDPLYTMSITINGQLLLCMLSEWLSTVSSVEIIQCNTDGITIMADRIDLPEIREIYYSWERYTALTLEENFYKRMYIRDVNNYIAEYEDGKVKAKGEYVSSNRDYNQDHSALIIPLAIQNYIKTGENPVNYIYKHTNKFDFMCLFKATKDKHKIKLLHGDNEIQKISRYYVSKKGANLTVVRPPSGIEGHYKKANGVSEHEYNHNDNSIYNAALHTKNKSKHAARYESIKSGKLISVCNNANDFNFDNLDYDYYISESNRLLKGLGL